MNSNMPWDILMNKLAIIGGVIFDVPVVIAFVFFYISCTWALWQT